MALRRKILMLAVMIACGATGAWINRSIHAPDADAEQIAAPQLDPTPMQQDATVPSPDQDKQCALLLQQSNRGEALAWLRDPNRAVSHWGKQEAIDLVRSFYAAGATGIYVVDTDRAGNAEIASQFIVTLPTIPSARKQIFAQEAAFEAQYGDDPTVDIGQNYLHLTTD